MQDDDLLKRRLLRRFLVIGVYLVLVAAIAYFTYYLVKPNSKPVCHNSSTSQCQSQTASTKAPVNKSQSTSPPKTNPSTNSSASSSTNQATSGSAAAPNSSSTGANSSNLANTGPGNIVGLFAGVSLLSGLVHFFLNKRRASN